MYHLDDEVSALILHEEDEEPKEDNGSGGS